MHMDDIHYLILGGAAVVLASIVAGRLSSRLGVPLLLVFLALGMAVGEEGLLHLAFRDTRAAYLLGSLALAVILFDGGLRTRREAMRIAAPPALTLATLGVVLTAGLTAVAAWLLLDLRPWQALLIGSVVGSTDAAAVFMLLHHRGLDLKKRVSATLEVESGVNDPMAIFLTVICVEALAGRMGGDGVWIVADFFWQMGVGGALGWLGGVVLVGLINRLSLAAGLYPILALAGALMVFGATLSLGASGFLAIYLVGYVVGNRRHRGGQLVRRFTDAFGWLSQIVLFLVLGLFVNPSELLPVALPALGIALVLTFLARPLAVWLCLLPFRFSFAERTFIAWVGLRGAVPIYLALIPLLYELPSAETVFAVAFVVVLVSLVLQGWTVPVAARLAGLEVPPAPEAEDRLDVDPLHRFDRELVAYRVAATSPAATHASGGLHLPTGANVVAVLRGERLARIEPDERMQPDDLVFLFAPSEQLWRLDRVFAAPTRALHEDDPALALGDFPVDPAARIADVVDFYGLPASVADRALSAADYVRTKLGQEPMVGDAVPLGAAELVVREVGDGGIERLGVRLDPATTTAPLARIGRRIRLAAGARWRRIRPRWRRRRRATEDTADGEG